MNTALVIGGTGFVGRHAVWNLVDHGYDVASLSRGNHRFQFADRPEIERLEGDRTDAAVLRDAASQVEPDVVIDCAAYHPADVRTATETFEDVGAYVYVSSGATYAAQDIPKREDETPLHDCTPEQATDDSMATYGPRKAACDRLVTEAAAHGVAATSVRPTVVYGPQVPPIRDGEPQCWTDEIPGTWADEDVPAIQTHHDYWIDRVARYDRVVVPGDGTAIWHRVYVEDLADALRIVAERGEPGEAYNAACAHPRTSSI